MRALSILATWQHFEISGNMRENICPLNVCVFAIIMFSVHQLIPLMNILILCSKRSHNSFSIKSLVKAAEEREHSVDVLDPRELYIQISNINGHDKIYRKEKRIFKKDYHAIIPRIGRGLQFGSYVVRHLNKCMGIYSTASADGLLNASDKLHTSQLLSIARVATPRTTALNTPEDYKFLIDSVGGLPCVAKFIKGSQGKGVFILESELGASTTLSSLRSIKQDVILQEFIESSKEDEKKNDIRVIVTGNLIVGAYRRFSVDDDFRSNYSISKAGEKVTLSKDEINLAYLASKAVGLDVSGVDLMRDTANNKTYCIEVNGNMSLAGFTKITGVDAASHIIKFVEDKVNIHPIKSASIESIGTGNDIMKGLGDLVRNIKKINVSALSNLPVKPTSTISDNPFITSFERQLKKGHY